MLSQRYCQHLSPRSSIIFPRTKLFGTKTIIISTANWLRITHGQKCKRRPRETSQCELKHRLKTFTRCVSEFLNHNPIPNTNINAISRETRTTLEYWALPLSPNSLPLRPIRENGTEHNQLYPHRYKIHFAKTLPLGCRREVMKTGRFS